MRGRRWTVEQGTRLAHLRIRAGILDRKKLALLARVHPLRLYRLEAALGAPDADELARLAAAVGVLPRDLLVA